MQCAKWNSGQWAVLILYVWAWIQSGTGEPVPKIDGHRRSAVTLKENTTHQFNCQSEGWNPLAPPLLAWYLNGQLQAGPANGTGPLLLSSSLSPLPEDMLNRSSAHNSTFTLRARKLDRELVCAASDPQSGESYNATVTLDVQFQPEIVRVNAHYSESAEPGLSLILFVLVRSNPPATITWVDQSGQLVTNTSDFLILDSRSYPWLTNHTLRVTLSSLASNVSVNANNSLGASHSSVTLTDFLQSRVEVPMLGILGGGIVAVLTLLLLSLLLLCVLFKNRRREKEKPEESSVAKSESSCVRFDAVYLPRENMSLPCNLRLNDLSALCKGREASRHNPGETNEGEEEEGERSEQDLSAAYAARGFSKFPMVGYIYKVSSMSSDEIWL